MNKETKHEVIDPRKDRIERGRKTNEVMKKLSENINRREVKEKEK